MPNKFNDWIGLRDESFNKFVEISNQKTKFKDGFDIFKCFSMGVVTNRDAWAYNYSKDNLSNNMKKTIDFYNTQLGLKKDELQYNKREIS